MVLGELRDFAPRDGDLYSVIDVMSMKYGQDGREYMESMEYLQPIAGCKISECTYDRLMELAKELLETPVYKGGKAGTDSGTKKLPEPMTILRKFAYLSAAINNLVKKGIHLDNNCLKVVAYLRELDKKKKARDAAR